MNSNPIPTNGFVTIQVPSTTGVGSLTFTAGTGNIATGSVVYNSTSRVIGISGLFNSYLYPGTTVTFLLSNFTNPTGFGNNTFTLTTYDGAGNMID